MYSNGVLSRCSHNYYGEEEGQSKQVINLIKKFSAEALFEFSPHNTTTGMGHSKDKEKEKDRKRHHSDSESASGSDSDDSSSSSSSSESDHDRDKDRKRDKAKAKSKEQDKHKEKKKDKKDKKDKHRSVKIAGIYILVYYCGLALLLVFHSNVGCDSVSGRLAFCHFMCSILSFIPMCCCCCCWTESRTAHWTILIKPLHFSFRSFPELNIEPMTKQAQKASRNPRRSHSNWWR
jgi:cation transport ATPase